MNNGYVFLNIYRLNNNNYSYEMKLVDNNFKFKKYEYDQDVDLSIINLYLINTIKKENKRINIKINLICFDLMISEYLMDKKVNELETKLIIDDSIGDFEDGYYLENKVLNKKHFLIYQIPKNLKEEFKELRNNNLKHQEISLDILTTAEYFKEHKNIFHRKKILLVIINNDLNICRIYKVEDMVLIGFILTKVEVLEEEILPSVIHFEQFDEILLKTTDELYQDIVKKYPTELIININEIDELKDFDYEKQL